MVRIKSHKELLEKLYEKLASWQTRFFPKVGTLTLATSDAILRNFLLKHTQQEMKLHCFNWDLATSPRTIGGLGIYDLQMQNLALFGKKV